MTILFVLSFTTLLLVIHAIWFWAKPPSAPLPKLEALEVRVSKIITTYNPRFASLEKSLSAVEELLSDLEVVEEVEDDAPSQQSDGPYRTHDSGERVPEDPPKVVKAFVCGQTVDVRFLDDAESEDGPLLRFSAIYVRFSKDANGKSQVWLRCDEEEKPEPYALEDVLLMHPGEAW